MPKGLSAYWKVDTSGLDFVEKEAPIIIDEATRQTAQDIADSVKENWSASSPSAPFTPPAVVTGYLDSTVKVVKRDAAGRFAVLKNTVSWTVRVEAEYAAALEFGNPVTGAAPRPFLTPAVNAAVDNLGRNITTGFKAFETIGAAGKLAYLARRGLG